MIKTKLGITLAGVLALTITSARADLFGSGGNAFTIDFVTIGNAGNVADTTGSPNPAGSVAYDYRIGKYEISRDMITKASTEGSLGITLADMTPHGGNGVNRPATGITWYEAGTFVNWLNTSSGGSAAYKFVSGSFALWTAGDTLDYDASNPYRSLRATYWLPSMDEWYKAAYYDPNTGTYFDYATGSNTAPTAVASGTTAGTAVYDQTYSTGPADITNTGGLSPYGTMAQNGNAWEWEETAGDLVNSTTGENRGLRSATWYDVAGFMPSSFRIDVSPLSAGADVGFRVAGVIPEPSSTVLMCSASLLALARRRRRAAL